jgi:hypothetical protein
MDRQDILFRDGDLRVTLVNLVERLKNSVNDWNPDQLFGRRRGGRG